MTRLVPHPDVYIAPSLMPAGYAIGAIRAEVGLNVESCHLLANAGTAYDNGRAANDNGPPNPKGHDRYLDGGIYFRPSRWFSGGYDLIQRPCSTCRPVFSMRIEGNWFTAGNDWEDGSHGMEISISLPSPRETNHCFFLERVSVITAHQTVTDRSNIPLTLSQRANRSVTCYGSFGIVYRF